MSLLAGYFNPQLFKDFWVSDYIVWLSKRINLFCDKILVLAGIIVSRWYREL